MDGWEICGNVWQKVRFAKIFDVNRFGKVRKQ